MKTKKYFIHFSLLCVISLSLQSCFFVVQKDKNTKSKLKSPAFSAIEREIFEFQNLARTQPKKIAALLRRKYSSFRGRTMRIAGGPNVRTEEGISAVREAIRFLERVKPLPPLKASRGMSLAGHEHIRRDGPLGRYGHDGNDGSSPFDRMNRHGRWLRIAGENLAYGMDTAEYVIIGLIIDDGVSSRGHRDNIFKRDFTVTGVAFGNHRRKTYMAVITYAGGYIDR